MRNAVFVFRGGRVVYQNILHWQMQELGIHSIPQWVNNADVDDLLSECQIDGTNQRKREAFTKWLNDIKKDLRKIPDLKIADVTFLHKLLPCVCYNKVAHPHTQEYQNRLADPDTLEHKVQKIKNRRNGVFHEEETAASGVLFDQLKKEIIDCMEKAFEVFNVTPSEKASKMSEVNDLFNGIISDTSSSSERLKQFIIDWLLSEGLVEIAATVKEIVPLGDNYAVNMPIDPIFHILTLSCEAEGPKKLTTGRMFLKCSDIFQEIKENITIINGDPGSGKTMLLRKSYLEVLRELSVITGDQCFEGIGNFTLPLAVECRSENSGSLVEYFQRTFDKLEGLKPYVVREVINTLKGLVFFIDGNDEANKAGKKLIDEITKYCSNKSHSASCYISSRNEAGAKLERVLSTKGIKCKSLVIEKITSLDDKESFLNKYSDYLEEGGTSQLIPSFRNLPPNVGEVFSTPILLALFCRLILESDESISRVKNILDIYRTLFQSIERKVANLIEDNGWTIARTAEATARDLMAAFYRRSLNLWQRGSFDFKTDDVSVLFDVWLGILESRTADDCKRILSSILTPEHSMRHKGLVTFQFPHLSIQEFASAEAIVSAFLSKIRERQSIPEDVSESQINPLDNCIGLETRKDGDKLR